jgi:hypothetical protein
MFARNGAQDAPRCGIATKGCFELGGSAQTLNSSVADFSRARFTARGPFLRLSLKVDQASLEDLLRRR